MAVLFVGSTLYSQHIAAQIDADALSIATNASPAIDRLSVARGELLRIQLSAVQAVDAAATGALVDRRSVHDGFRRLHRALAAYLELPFYPDERTHWASVDEHVREFERQVTAELAALTTGRAADAKKLLAEQAWPSAEAADRALEELIIFNSEQQHRLGTAIPLLRGRAGRAAYGLDAVSATLGLLLMAMVYLDHRRRMRAQARLTARLETVAAASVRIAETVTSTGDRRALFQRILEEARVAVEADYAALGIGSDAPTSFEAFASSPDSLAPAPAHGARPLLDASLSTRLRHEGRSIATLLLARRRGRPPFTNEDEHVIDLLGTHAAVAAENAELYRRLRRQHAMLELLADSTIRMIQTLDYSERLQEIANAMVPALADVCVIRMVDAEASFSAPIVAAARPEWTDTVTEIFRRYPTLTAGHHALRARQQQGPELLVVTPEVLRELAHDAEHLRLLEQLPKRVALSVPLIGHDRLLGVCSFLSAEEGHFGEAEVAVAEELARRAALAIENARLYERAEAARRAREEVLAIVSHDLRSPLSTIGITAELLCTGEASRDPKVHKAAERLKRASDQMSRLIGDLLEAAKIDSGTLRLVEHVERVDTLVADALELFGAPAAQRSVTLEADVATAIPDVLCDRERILQVFSNLLGNALKFTPPGGHITLRVEASGPEVRFSVIDSGPGIAEEDLAHLFDRYWQSRSSPRAGAGLGLHIAHGIVQAHRGRIWAETRPGSGAAFSFVLPAVGVER